MGKDYGIKKDGKWADWGKGGYSKDVGKDTVRGSKDLAQEQAAKEGGKAEPLPKDK